MSDFIAGDTIEEDAILWKNKAANLPYSIPTDGTAVLTAYITDPKRQKIVVLPVTIAHAAEGNDWLNGAIHIIFNKSMTGELAGYDGKQVLLVAKVVIGEKQRRFKLYQKAVKIP